MTKKEWLLLVVAIVAGWAIAWIDSRPTWDDAGITAGMLLVAAGCFAFAVPRKPWMWVLAVGIWIPLWNIVVKNNYGSLLVLLFTFVGAYAGMGVRKLVTGK